MTSTTTIADVATKIAGVTNRGAWTSSPTSSGKVTIPAGYHSGSGYVDTSGVYNTGQVSIKRGTKTATFSIAKSTSNSNYGTTIASGLTKLEYVGISSYSVSTSGRPVLNSLSATISGTNIVVSLAGRCENAAGTATVKIVYVGQ